MTPNEGVSFRSVERVVHGAFVRRGWGYLQIALSTLCSDQQILTGISEYPSMCGIILFDGLNWGRARQWSVIMWNPFHSAEYRLTDADVHCWFHPSCWHR